MAHIITKKELLLELYIAEEDARKHKTRKSYVVEFEKNLHINLLALCEELYSREYKPGQSVCFIINDPKKREVFAARYRDRIVHHLYYNLTHKLFERTFIYDTYSCIKGRGTHFGINRLCKHIRSESNNYKDDCYILKMDIKGYFMHIDRNLLYEITFDTLKKQENKEVIKGLSNKWGDVVDFDFVYYLTKELILFDPTIDCNFRGNLSAWNGLPSSKSLFNSPKGYGLPIGNLTSQLFSNVFLNVFDQFCKRKLKCKHYGRYVDDFYVVSKDKKWLHSIIPLIETFLSGKMHLQINKGKTKISTCKQGVEFLGTFIKQYRKYISNACLKRLKKRLFRYEKEKWNIGKNIEMVVNSCLGMFQHNSSYKIRKELFSKLKFLNQIGIFNKGYTKFFKIS